MHHREIFKVQRVPNGWGMQRRKKVSRDDFISANWVYALYCTTASFLDTSRAQADEADTSSGNLQKAIMI